MKQKQFQSTDFHNTILRVLVFGVLGILTQAKGTILGVCKSPMDDINRFGYIVSIRSLGSRQHICTGVLVQPNAVITVAHCVDTGSPFSAGRKPIVHVGGRHVDDIRPDIEVFTVKESFIHPNWDGKQRSSFNIAVLILSGKTKQPTPQMLTDQINLQTGMKMAALGWGSAGDVINVGEEVFGDLKYENQEFIDGSHCNRTIFWEGGLPNDIFCGLNDWHKSSCLVDSGAPLVLLDMPKHQIQEGTPRLDHIAGINLDGAPCGETNKPDIYLDIRVVASWIQEKAKEK